MLANTQLLVLQQSFNNLFYDYKTAVEVCRTDPDYRSKLSRKIAYNVVKEIDRKPNTIKGKVLDCLNAQRELKEVIAGSQPSKLQAFYRYEKLLTFCVNTKYKF